jgi:hypothetical protein
VGDLYLVGSPPLCIWKKHIRKNPICLFWMELLCGRDSRRVMLMTGAALRDWLPPPPPSWMLVADISGPRNRRRAYRRGDEQLIPDTGRVWGSSFLVIP